MKKKLDNRKLRDKCDVIFSKLVRQIGYCEKCGNSDPKSLQCAHIVSRVYLQTRHDLRNAMCLCVKCHIYEMHRNPLEFMEWFNERYGMDYYDEMKKRARVEAPIDWEERHKYLKDLLERSL